MPTINRVITTIIFLYTCILCHQNLLAQDSNKSIQIEWLKKNAHAVELESDNFDDLAFLKPLLKDKRIVQLGENTHGVGEYSVLKSRIVQYLHQELGYEVLALESDLYQCYIANLTADKYPAFSTTNRSTLIGSVIGVWHTKEVLPLFEYIRNSHKTDTPLQLAGFDIQPIGSNKRSRPAFLSKQIEAFNADYAKQVLELDQRFLKVYSQNSSERRAFFRSDEGQNMAKQYDQLAEFLKENAKQLEDSSDEINKITNLIARQSAASMAQYIRQQSAPTTADYFKNRDKGMADNFIALAEEMYPGKKIIVWAHNFHIRHDNLSIPPVENTFPDFTCDTMGKYLHEKYRDKLYTVGLYAYQGSAANNRGHSFEIKPAEEGTIEKLLHDAKFKTAFIDLTEQVQSPATDWIFKPVNARYNCETPLKIIPNQQYNAILFFDKVSPRVMLY